MKELKEYLSRALPSGAIVLSLNITFPEGNVHIDGFKRDGKPEAEREGLGWSEHPDLLIALTPFLPPAIPIPLVNVIASARALSEDISFEIVKNGTEIEIALRA